MDRAEVIEKIQSLSDEEFKLFIDSVTYMLKHDTTAEESIKAARSNQK